MSLYFPPIIGPKYKTMVSFNVGPIRVALWLIGTIINFYCYDFIVYLLNALSGFEDARSTDFARSTDLILEMPRWGNYGASVTPSFSYTLFDHLAEYPSKDFFEGDVLEYACFNWSHHLLLEFHDQELNGDKIITISLETLITKLPTFQGKTWYNTIWSF